MAAITPEEWKARIAGHFKHLENTGGPGTVKCGDLLQARELMPDLNTENRVTLDLAVDELVQSGLVERRRTNNLIFGYDIAVTVAGISKFI